MKKILVILLFLISLTGCYNYSSGSQYGRLESITFFNTDYEEIEGEYKDYFDSLFDNYNFRSSTFILNNNMQPLNSPAPVYNYYCAEINEGDDVIVRFKIKCNNDYQFNSLRLNDNQIKADEFYKIEVIDKYAYIDLLLENIQQDSNLFKINNFYMEKNIGDEVKIVQGSVSLGNRTYISGFYFFIKESENND